MPFHLSKNVLSSMYLMISPSGQWWFADVAGRCGWCCPADAFRYWVWLIYTTDSVIEKSSISLCYVFMRNGMSPLAVLCVFPEAKVTPVLNRSITKQDTKGCKISMDSSITAISGLYRCVLRYTNIWLFFKKSVADVEIWYELLKQAKGVCFVSCCRSRGSIDPVKD